MSHVSSSSVIAKDLDALRQAVKMFPELTWVEGQETHEWWGTWANDFSADDAAYKRHGIDPKDYGKCSHAIKVRGTTWEIGVVKRPDGKGYALVYDFYGSKGKPIQDAIGKEACKLSVQYSKYATINAAKKQGYFVSQKVLPNGGIAMQLQRV